MASKDGYPAAAELAAALEGLLARRLEGMRSSETYAPLARQFGLTTEQENATRRDILGDSHDGAYWANRVQNARKDLMQVGKLAASETGVWILKAFERSVDADAAFQALEGALERVVSNRFERDPALRAACLVHHGTACLACGLDMGQRYGEDGRGFIHVHHTMPLSSVGARHKVDARTDLVPLCPNCHTMIHRQEPPLSVDAVRALIRGNAPPT